VVKSMALPARAGAGRLVLVRAPRGRAEVDELVAQFSAWPDVEYAEPNYVASVLDDRATAARAEPLPARRLGPPGARTSAREIAGEDLVATGLYPSDTYHSWGFDFVDADVIWTNTAVSPLVAVIDTGVDYTHPDLVGKVVKGYNFVEGTADPMDNCGIGTNVAGVISARLNNAVGVAGISNGNVLAIKAFDHHGSGTLFEVAQALYYAANNTAVRVIQMGPAFAAGSVSTTLEDAVRYAVVTKGKLLVAAAGYAWGIGPTRWYPAAYSEVPEFLNRVLAVSASGVDVTASTDGQSVFIQECRAGLETYGTWLSVTAPGRKILSTFPTRPSYLGVYNYGTLNLDSAVASAHVAAVAARVWSVNPLFTSVQVGERLTGGGASPQPVWLADTGPVDVDGDGIDEIEHCWDPAWATQGGTAGRTLPSLARANVAMGMQRGEIVDIEIYDATDGNALPSGAVVQAFQGTALKGQMTMTSLGQVWAVISNLPWSTTPYTLKVNKAGYTHGAQAFGTVTLRGSPWTGYFTSLGIPKLGTNLTFVTNRLLVPGSSDVSQHLLLPPDQPFDVGSPPRLTSSGGYGTGSLVGYPFARQMASSGSTRLGNHEATAVKALYPTTTGPYRLFNRDYRNGWDLSYGKFTADDYDYSPVGPVTRLWKGGVIKATVSVDWADVQTSPPCMYHVVGGTAACDKWHVGNLSSAGVFTPVNIIGDGVNDAVVPYGGANLRGGIAAAPMRWPRRVARPSVRTPSTPLGEERQPRAGLAPRQ
jgi:hypothetical protein